MLTSPHPPHARLRGAREQREDHGGVGPDGDRGGVRAVRKGRDQREGEDAHGGVW